MRLKPFWFALASMLGYGLAVLAEPVEVTPPIDVAAVDAALGVEVESVEQLIGPQAGKRGKRIDLPAGVVNVPRSLTWPNVEGGVVSGDGAAQAIDITHPLSGPVTRLVWTGDRPTADSLLNYTGAETAFRDFCIDGATRAEIDAGIARGGVGFRMTKAAEGLGVGGVTLENVFFNYWDTALEIGTHVGEHNCERSTWRKLRFQRCGVGVRVRNIQGMLHVFEQPEFSSVENPFLINAGGKLAINDPFIVSPCTFLKLDPVPGGLAQNNCKYTVRGLVADNYAGESTLLECKPGAGYWGEAVFEGGHVAYLGYTRPAFKVSGALALTVRDFSGVQRKWFRWDNTAKLSGQILIENSRCWGVRDPLQLLDVAGSRGPCHVIVRDCYDEHCRAIPNLDRVLTGGPQAQAAPVVPTPPPAFPTVEEAEAFSEGREYGAGRRPRNIYPMGHGVPLHRINRDRRRVSPQSPAIIRAH